MAPALPEVKRALGGSALPLPFAGQANGPAADLAGF
jgi:hypothetical protein